ncbi:MAG: secondary thiamine-phosphate synthase enzyme YjbQ [Proteobacteria bacterium]|nr:secondary thiamine-phosphate synthase enzyme YjbQ [Pseudomonadota bacterium]MBU1571133.1 secondary thiamine-phosphate synthase enzyme YjbQ [Pseudomonadota bacterium]
MVDITAKIQEAVSASCAGKSMEYGLCMIYVPHTTAAVTINESADPDVKSDILMILNKIVPWEAGYRHLEGNSPAHVKATLVGASEFVAFENKKLLLGTWQGIFFCEFDGPRTRKVHVKMIWD